MNSKYILALDLGTTGNRALVFDKNQKIVSEVYEEFPQIYPKPGWVEHDAVAIWDTVERILKKTFRSIPPESIQAIGITNQRETVVIWDGQTGKPLYHAIVWQCRRTAAYCESLKKKNSAWIHKKTGLVLDAYFSASKIRWLMQQVPGAMKLARKGRLLCGTIDSWVVWNLTGRKDHITDSSNASRTLLFNIHTKSWDKRLCQLFEVPLSILPRVVPSSAVVAYTQAKQTGGVSIPIASMIGDQQAAAFAQGCYEKGVIKNTYGTGLFLLECTKETPKFSKNLLTTIAWSIGDLKHTEYAVEGSVFIGGAAIQWLRDGLKIIQKASDTESMARSIESNEGVYFVPALVGLGAPHWDSKARGMLIGLTRGTTRAHIARAALESIAYQTRDMLDVMQKDTHQSFKSLRVDGGAAKSNFLMQFQADILGIPVERPRILETTALGAAAMAGIATGFWKNKIELASLRRMDRIFWPKMPASQRELLYNRWKESVSRSKNWA